MIPISIDGTSHEVAPGERLIDAINRAGISLSQVCYLPILGPLQTCDTCIVEVDGKLVRACAAVMSAGMKISTTASRAHAARTEAFDRILRNHESLLHGVRQQQRQLHGPQHYQAARHRTPALPFSNEA